MRRIVLSIVTAALLTMLSVSATLAVGSISTW
jgi:hypothetical protein